MQGDGNGLGGPRGQLSIHTLSISELEEQTGFPRSTIYYYVRRGLVPCAQKAGRSWALYTDLHLELLLKIKRLKEDGRDLDDILRLLGTDSLACHDEVDLVARKTEQTRKLILDTAIRHFINRGYKNTRIADLANAVGMLPPVFYRYFATKRALFDEAVSVFLDWMLNYLEPQIADEPDVVVRHMKRVNAFLRTRSLGPDLFTFIRAEALGDDEDSRQVMKSTYRKLVELIENDLNGLRSACDTSSHPSVEMMAFGLMGVMEDSAMRLSWDSQCAEEDYYHTNLLMFLAARAALTQEPNLRAAASQYTELIASLVGSIPPPPTDLTETSHNGV
jgi:AcrR family transcriptional regulator